MAGGWRTKLGALLTVLLGLAIPATVFAATTTVTIGVGATTTLITGSASPGALVTFLADGATAGSTIADGAGDYSQVLTDQTPGIHTYEIYAKDAAGRLSDTVSVEVSVAEHEQTHVSVFIPPTLELSDNEVTQGEAIGVQGSTAANATVMLYIDGSYALTTADSSGVWQYTLETAAIEPGEHQLYAVAVKSGGEQSHATQIHTFIIDAQPPSPGEPGTPPPSNQQPPKVPAIGGPKSGTTITGHEVVIYGTAEPGAQIEIWNRDRLIGSVFADKDGNWRIRLSLTEFANELKVRACKEKKCSPFSSSIRIFLAKPPASASALRLSLSRYRLQSNAHTTASLRASVTGGAAPYTVRINWGDGYKESLSTRQSLTLFSHVFEKRGNFNGVVTVVDSAGQSSAAYFSTQVYAPPAAVVPHWALATIGATAAVSLIFATGGYQPINKLRIRLGLHIRPR